MDAPFERGFFANGRVPAQDVPERRRWQDLPVPPFAAQLAEHCDDELGALALQFTGRGARRGPTVRVIVDGAPWLFSTTAVDALLLPSGVKAIHVPQSRVGANAGAVRIVTGSVTLLEFKVGPFGPPTGKFLRQTGRLLPIDHFGNGPNP